jgi:hypothetical protein
VLLRNSLRRNNNSAWLCCPRIRKPSAFTTPCSIRNFPFHLTSPLLIFSTCKIRINYWFRIFCFEVVMLLGHPYLFLGVVLFSECMDFFNCVDSLKVQCSHTYRTQKVIILVNFQSSMYVQYMLHLNHHLGVDARFRSCFSIFSKLHFSFLAYTLMFQNGKFCSILKMIEMERIFFYSARIRCHLAYTIRYPCTEQSRNPSNFHCLLSLLLNA